MMTLLYKIGLTFVLRWNLYFLWSRIVRLFTYRWRGYLPVELEATQLQRFLNRQTWRKDPWWQLGDAIDWPRLFVRRGCGDCDEFAVTALDKGRHGVTWENDHYMPYGLLTVVYDGGGHNVALFKTTDGKSLLHMGNWGIHGPFETIEAAVANICKTRKPRGWRLTSASLKTRIAYRIY